MKVLALNKNGSLTYCTVPPEDRGKGRCDHVLHREDGQSTEDFIKQVEEYKSNHSNINHGTHLVLDQYKMSDEEKDSLTEIKGRKQLEDRNNNGGYIHLNEPLWNDMDKNKFSQISGISKSNINDVLANKKVIVIYVASDIKEYKLGQVFSEDKAKSIKSTLGNKIKFGCGVKSLNELGNQFNFEATKDIYVLPYYMRQDPPEGSGKNPLNVLYNYVIYNRNDYNKQQEAYEKLLNNDKSKKPLTTKGGYKSPSLATLFAGKSGIIRNYITGRTVSYTGRAVVNVDASIEYGNIKIPAYILTNVFKPTISDQMIKEGKNESDIEEFLSKFNKNQNDVDQKDNIQLENMISKAGVKVIVNRQPSLHKASLLAFRPLVSGDATIKMNPMNFKGFAADVDGDTLTISGINSANISNKAEQEIGAKTNNGTKMPRYQSENINLPTKDSLFGLINILSKATPHKK
jgi:hypothetical protein